MAIQTVFKAGNSEVIALPKNLGFKAGDKVVVNPGLKKKSAFVSLASEKSHSSITPDFVKIIDGINKRYSKALSELSRK